MHSPADSVSFSTSSGSTLKSVLFACCVLQNNTRKQIVAVTLKSSFAFETTDGSEAFPLCLISSREVPLFMFSNSFPVIWRSCVVLGCMLTHIDTENYFCSVFVLPTFVGKYRNIKH